MGFAETGERNWQKMSVADRRAFLGELTTVINRRPAAWWNDMAIEAIARIPSFNLLPRDLRGHLIMAMTEDGFSIEKYAKAQKIMDDMRPAE